MTASLGGLNSGVGTSTTGRGTIMTNSIFNRANPRREVATRRAFFVWMAAYVVVIVTIAIAHSMSGVATGTAINADGVRTQQAKMSGEPQSLMVERPSPQTASLDIEG